MDLQKFVDGFYSMTCILSVEKTANGCGDICIAAVNRKFLDIMAFLNCPDPADIPNFKFIPGSRYDEYLTRNPSFEDICYNCAVLKKPLHTSVRLDTADMWFNLYVMPVDYEEDGKCYCTYSFERTEPQDLDLLSGHSPKTTADVLKTCIKLHGSDDLKKTMEEVITDIRILCGAAVCTIMLTDSSSGTCEVVATSISENSTLKRVTQFTNFYDIAVSWEDTIGDNDCLIIKNEKDMQYISEINRPWYLTLTEAGVDSVVMFPLRHGGETMGFIWATNFDTKDTLRIKETLELTTFFISSEIASYRMMSSLEQISYTDMLTGVKNRNALNKLIEDREAGKENAPFGVIFADLNGLKRVNDIQGHFAGDLLLRKAAILLQELFEGRGICRGIYRTGGDEFTILLSCIGRDELEEEAGLLRKRADDPDKVCFAVGSCYAEPGSDIRDAMHTADEDMYRNKEEYYSRYPERKYR